jgi:hypothetical protein
VRWLVGENARPTAHGSIHTAVIDVSAHARLEYRLGDRDAQHVVLAGLDTVEFLREDPERARNRRLHDGLDTDARLFGCQVA